MKTSILLAMALSITAITGCDLFDDSRCGPKQTFDLYLLGSSIVDSTTGVYYSYMDGTKRVFQWSQLVEEVCTDEHAKIEARVALLDETTTGIDATGGADWFFLFGGTFPMTKSGSDIKGHGEAGLKQAFDKEPAWFVPKLEVSFPTKGSYGADTAFLKNNVISIELTAKYRKH